MQLLKLNNKQTQELKERGSVQVTFKGLPLEVYENGTIRVMAFTGAILNPVEFGSNRLVLTLAQGSEAIKTGKTTHTKDGITYDIECIATNGGLEYVAYPRVSNVVTHIVTSDNIIEVK